MYINRNISRKPSSKIEVDGKRVIRVYDSQVGDYVVNTKGFLASDFATLNAREDSYQMALALSRMRELDAKSNIPEGATFEQAVALIRPRWCQSPAELDRFEQYCIDNALDFYKKLKTETPKDVKEAVGAAVAAADAATVQPKTD